MKLERVLKLVKSIIYLLLGTSFSSISFTAITWMNSERLFNPYVELKNGDFTFSEISFGFIALLFLVLAVVEFISFVRFERV